jgi:hypothetical protein
MILAPRWIRLGPRCFRTDWVAAHVGWLNGAGRIARTASACKLLLSRCRAPEHRARNTSGVHMRARFRAVKCASAHDNNRRAARQALARAALLYKRARVA